MNNKEIQDLIKTGYKVQLDKDGNILFLSYWYPELIVSKIVTKK
jgi:hypothetical protein